MKIHCAIKSCHKNHARRTAVLDTWFRPLQNLDVDTYFIVGSPRLVIPDTLSCEVSDAFKNIAPKILCACMHALDNNADLLFIADDDTYVVANRLMAAVPKHLDYVGFMRTWGLAYNKDVPYAQGSAQWLSARAMEHVVRSTMTYTINGPVEHAGGIMVPGVIDDGALGRALDGKVAFTHDRRYWPGPEWGCAPKDFITTHKCLPEGMRVVHEAMHNV